MEDREQYYRYAIEEFNQALSALRGEVDVYRSHVPQLKEEDISVFLHYHQAMLQVIQFAQTCPTCTRRIDFAQIRASACELDQQRQQYANDLSLVDMPILQTFMQSCVERLKPLALLCEPCCAEIQQQIATLFYAMRHL